MNNKTYTLNVFVLSIIYKAKVMFLIHYYSNFSISFSNYIFDIKTIVNITSSGINVKNMRKTEYINNFFLYWKINDKNIVALRIY